MSWITVAYSSLLALLEIYSELTTQRPYFRCGDNDTPGDVRTITLRRFQGETRDA